MSDPATGLHRQRAVRVWDLPTRLFHWSLVLCVVGSFASAWIGGAAMSWHLGFGFAVFAMLLFLSAQVATGLFADDEVATTGPLNKLVSSATGLWLSGYHQSVGQWALLALIALHVAAILTYRLRLGTDLIGPMISGDKLLPAGVPASHDDRSTRALAVVLLTACAAVVACVVVVAGG